MAQVRDALAQRSAGASAVPSTLLAGPGLDCAVCAYRDRSVERRLFFAVAEGISEPSFLATFTASGGYCPRHARLTLVRGEGPRYGYAYLHGLPIALRRLSEMPARGLEPCVICLTEGWAEDHAVWALATSQPSGDASAQLGPDAELCLTHASALVRRAPWRRYGEARRRLIRTLAHPDPRSPDPARAALDSPEIERSVRACLSLVAGSDHDAGPRGPLDSVSGPATTAERTVGAVGSGDTSWTRGLLTGEGLCGELVAGRCPACSASQAATTTFLAWLAGEERTANELRDLQRLCGEHAWWARAAWPRAVIRALDGSRERWSGRLATLPPAGPASRWRERLGPVSRASLLAASRPAETLRAALDRALRPVDCLACRAAVTAAERTIELVDVTLADPAGARAYTAGTGLCLRHLDRGLARLSERSRAIVLERAGAMVGLLAWELAEALRKSSWSVRYEPPGPEVGAWRRAMAYAAGDPAVAPQPVPADPARPLAAI